jgi:hypothetical protein
MKEDRNCQFLGTKEQKMILFFRAIGALKTERGREEIRHTSMEGCLSEETAREETVPDSTDVVGHGSTPKKLLTRGNKNDFGFNFESDIGS